jgi:hypothetical protein
MAPPRTDDDPLDRVIDLGSGQTAGWMFGGRGRVIPPDAISLALASSRRLSGGRFLAVPLWSSDHEHVSRQLDASGRLDGLALLLRGPIDRKSLSMLEQARERGALLGCDTTAALQHFAALSPDLLSVRAPGLGALRGRATAAAVVRVLAGMADAIGARVLAHHVTSNRQSQALRHLGIALAQGEPFGMTSPRLAAGRPNVTYASFRRVKRSFTASPLGKGLPTLPVASSAAALVDVCLAHTDHDWIVLVDERSHPVRLIERAALLCGEPFEHRPIRVSPGVSLQDVAQSAVDRPASERSRPLVLCDHAGRYRGLLMLERRSNALAASPY